MEFDCQLASINELKVLEGLSVRAYNVCMNGRLKNIAEIVSYYTKYGNFLRIRNCGRKTDNELVTLCLKYRSMLIEIPSYDDLEEEDLAEEIEVVAAPLGMVEQLSQAQVDMLNFYIIYYFLRLSKKTSKILRDILCNDLSLKNVWYSLLQADFDPYKEEQIGSRSAQEIISMIAAIKAQAYRIERRGEILLQDEEFQRLSRRVVSFPEVDSENRHSAIGIRIFSLLNELIENGGMFLPREKVVFDGSLACYTNAEKKTFDELGRSLGLCSERVRQIREYVYSRLLEVLSHFRTLAPNVVVQYGLDAVNPCFAIDEAFVSTINRNEGTSFNSHFIGKVISVILSDRFILLGDEMETYYNKRLKESYHWKKQYLVQRQYADAYDFTTLIDSLNFQVKISRLNSIPFNLMAYLPQLHKDGGSDMLNENAEVAEYLLHNELDLVFDQHKSIVINMNIHKNESDYIYEILEELKRPANVYELYNKMKERCPNETISIDNLRYRCQRDPRMIFFGRSSTYGLKIWEAELNLKGGTIRSIVEEFLQQYDEPKHMDDITQYVQKYRNTDKKAISANLHLEKGNRFKFFGHHMWGLSAKEYTQQSNILKVRLN
jgi:hypothetical protein